MNPYEQIERIQQKIYMAERADRHLKVFGASSHKYQLSAPAPLKQIEAFEQTHGIRLPQAYRLFLEYIGNGGPGYAGSAAGPYYGIYPLGKNMQELFDEPQRYLKAECILHPKMTDEFWKALNSKIDNSNDLSDEEYDHARGKIFGGILPIGSQGCSYIHGLVLNGPYKGRVVNLDMDGQKPRFAFENDFLDWYERWLDEVISGDLIKDDPSWFGFTKGGTEESLLPEFINSADAEDKNDCLNGLLNKQKLKDDTVNQVEDLINDNPAHKTLLIQVLAKSSYAKAKPYLLALVSSDLLSVFQFVYFYAKDKAGEWLQVIEENIGRIHDAETLRYCAYLLKEANSNYGRLLAPFTKSSNDAVRLHAFYALGDAKDKKECIDVFIEGLNDSSNDVVRTTLQALAGFKDKRLPEHYKKLAERFPEDQDYILVNLNYRLAEFGLTIPGVLNQSVMPGTSQPPPAKKKWYQIWK